MKTKDELKAVMTAKLNEKLQAIALKEAQGLFEKEDEATNRLKDKVDAIRKDVADLEIRRRNTKNDTFKKTTGDQIDNKRAQARALQKSLKTAQSNKSTKPAEKKVKDE